MRTAEFFYGIMLITFFYSLYKYRGNLFYVFIILLFYDGMFSYAGTGIWNLYKVLLPILALYCITRYRLSSITFHDERLIIISFIIFSLSFLYSSFINEDYFKLIFSQYAKYFNLFISFLILKRIAYDSYSFEKIKNLLYTLLVIQIILTVIKYYIWGIRESVVGSISFTGGAAATVLPILGFVFIWITKRGSLKNKDWLILALLMFISFVSMKRAIWFIMPLVVFLFYTYIPRKKLSGKLLFVIPIIPLIFYLGVKNNPSLNPEHKFGGTFDLNYVFNFAKEYTFGTDEKKTGTGRGGATLLLIDKLFSLEYSENDLIGNGLKPIYAAERDTYDNPGFGINQRGSATGVFQTFISAGFLGIITTLAFSFSMLFQLKSPRLRNVIIGIFLWEYFLYTGIILRTPALSFLLVFSVIYAKIESEKTSNVILVSSPKAKAETSKAFR